MQICKAPLACCCTAGSSDPNKVTGRGTVPAATIAFCCPESLQIAHDACCCLLHSWLVRPRPSNKGTAPAAEIACFVLLRVTCKLLQSAGACQPAGLTPSEQQAEAQLWLQHGIPIVLRVNYNILYSACCLPMHSWLVCPQQGSKRGRALAAVIASWLC